MDRESELAQQAEDVKRELEEEQNEFKEKYGALLKWQDRARERQLEVHKVLIGGGHTPHFFERIYVQKKPIFTTFFGKIPGVFFVEVIENSDHGNRHH